MLKNPINNLEGLQKNIQQLLADVLENQTITIRRLGVKVADFSEIEGQRDITNYF
jgi:DNA polymerase IV (DinB-like DNA polymerase)